MNAKAAKLGLHDTHFVRPDGLDAPGEYSSAADVTRLARLRDAEPGSSATPSPKRRRRSPAGGCCTPGTTCSRQLPERVRREDGPHRTRPAGARSPRSRGRGVDDLRDDPRQPVARRSATPTSSRSSSGGSRSTGSCTRCSAGRVYATCALPYGRAPLALVAARPLQAVARVGRPLTERVVGAGRRLAAGAARAACSAGSRSGRARTLVGRRDLVAARTVREAEASRSRSGGTRRVQSTTSSSFLTP